MTFCLGYKYKKLFRMKNCFIGLEDEIKKEINDELNNNEEELKTWDNLYSKIKNWEKVTTCWNTFLLLSQLKS